jgi:hypothetical protein
VPAGDVELHGTVFEQAKWMSRIPEVLRTMTSQHDDEAADKPG